MPKPVILSLDDDPSVLNSIERDLRARYGKDYRILPINQGKPALEYLNKMKQRNETVALFLVDQRMPEMSGTEFLEEAIKQYPQAKRVLLTAYADTQAAIASINEIGLDYYLMKPWHPPDEKLYPVLDELLEDWKAHVRLPYEGIRIAGTLWSLTSHQVKDFLTRHQIPYQWLDIEKDSEARALVENVSSGAAKLPVVFFPDGMALIQPGLKELADRVGLQTKAELPFYDIIIVGSGPAGLACAVYAGSEGYRCLVVERSAPGGDRLTGAGIYYGAAYTEAMNYKDKDVFVVGGANSAAQGALYLTRFARKVTVLIRGSAPTASKYLIDAMEENDKLEMSFNTDLVELKGETTLEQIVVRNTVTDEVQTFDASALFVFIGVRPQSQLVAGLVKCNEKGYIFTGPDLIVDKNPPPGWTPSTLPLVTGQRLERAPFLLETSVPGIFAAGDVRYGTNHRVASAAGEGAIAFALMKEYLKSL